MAALGFGVALFGALRLAVRPPGERSVTAEFSDVRGLVSGAQVRVAGVPVGEVTGVWLGRDGWPRVRMSVDSDVSLRSGASAAVRMASLSGEFNRYVSLVQGTGAPLGPGAVIPRSRTSSPVEVDEALLTFAPATREAIARALLGLRAAVQGRGSALAASLRLGGDSLAQVAAAAADIGGDGPALARLLEDTHLIAHTVAARAPALGRDVAGLAGLLEDARAHAAGIGAALHGLPVALEATEAALRRGSTLIAPVGSLLRAAAPGVALLPGTAREARSALLQARPALREAHALMLSVPGAARSLTVLLGRARPLLEAMAPVLRRLGPMLDQLRVRLPDAFSFFANWADFTSNYDANGHGARVGIVAPPAPDRRLSPDSNGAGQLAAPYLRTPGSLDGEPWRTYAQSFVGGRG